MQAGFTDSCCTEKYDATDALYAVLPGNATCCWPSAADRARHYWTSQDMGAKSPEITQVRPGRGKGAGMLTATPPILVGKAILLSCSVGWDIVKKRVDVFFEESVFKYGEKDS